jgi:hypothetical protein
MLGCRRSLDRLSSLFVAVTSQVVFAFDDSVFPGSPKLVCPSQVRKVAALLAAVVVPFVLDGFCTSINVGSTVASTDPFTSNVRRQPNNN